MGKLENRVAIITGASYGMGQAEAILFAKEGAKVIGAARTTAKGEETIRMIREAGGDAIFVRTDISKTADVDNLIKSAVDTYGRLDVLVNNAGITGIEGSTVDCPEELFDRTIAVNLKGTWLGMKYAIPEMLKSGGGSIVNISSICAIEAFLGTPAYSASKGGIISLTRVTAYEFASKNIRINCVVPGLIPTPMIADYYSPEEFEDLAMAIPQRRLGTPEEVAQVTLFLASGESSYIVGETVVVDGGMTMRRPYP